MCLSSWVNGKRESVESIINKRTYFDKMIFHFNNYSDIFVFIANFFDVIVIWIIFIITIMF